MKKLSYVAALMMTFAVATTASAAPSFATAPVVNWVGYSADPNEGYFIEPSALTDVTGAPLSGSCTGAGVRVYFHQWVNGASLTAHSAAAIDQLMRLLTAAYLSGRPVRLGVEHHAGTNKCYMRSSFLRP